MRIAKPAQAQQMKVQIKQEGASLKDANTTAVGSKAKIR